MLKLNPRRNALKILAAVAGVVWVLSLPEPDPESIMHYRNAVVVLFAVVYSGKTLYDTLFYDRYA